MANNSTEEVGPEKRLEDDLVITLKSQNSKNFYIGFSFKLFSAKGPLSRSSSVRVAQSFRVDWAMAVSESLVSGSKHRTRQKIFGNTFRRRIHITWNLGLGRLDNAKT